jgi:hypothetical protein
MISVETGGVQNTNVCKPPAKFLYIPANLKSKQDLSLFWELLDTRLSQHLPYVNPRRCNFKRSRLSDLSCDLNKVSVAKQKRRLLHNGPVVALRYEGVARVAECVWLPLLMETTFESVASRRVVWPSDPLNEAPGWMNLPSPVSLLSHQLFM